MSIHFSINHIITQVSLNSFTKKETKKERRESSFECVTSLDTPPLADFLAHWVSKRLFFSFSLLTEQHFNRQIIFEKKREKYLHFFNPFTRNLILNFNWHSTPCNCQSVWVNSIHNSLPRMYVKKFFSTIPLFFVFNNFSSHTLFTLLLLSRTTTRHNVRVTRSTFHKLLSQTRQHHWEGEKRALGFYWEQNLRDRGVMRMCEASLSVLTAL